MQLRFAEDRRTIFWAFVLFPLAPALAYARPALLPWLLPLLFYTSYCAGVLTHNHVHCPVFVARRSNVAYGAWLSLFYGFPIFSWIPTHNQNHHRYLDGDGDATQTTRLAPNDTLLGLLVYPLASARAQLAGIAGYVRDARHRPRRLARILAESAALFIGHAVWLGLAVALHGAVRGTLVYGVAVALPAALATYFMMFTNYLQHRGCDPASPDDHSRNFTSPFFNWFVFDNGLHTVHHEHPGVHWSRYRTLHDARASRIDPVLNQRSLFEYVAKVYVIAPVARAFGVLGGSRVTKTRAATENSSHLAT
ncbi:MAG TPA: fatty acid desaturase [Polyangiaceae bacterium]